MLQLLGLSGLKSEWDQEKYGEDAGFGVRKFKFKYQYCCYTFFGLKNKFRLPRASASFLWQDKLDEASM